MNDLLNIRNIGEYPVSGRELHGRLGVGTAYKDWFPRMREYGFEEEKDFNTLKNERVQIEGGREVSREVVDHTMTLSMAKELCMLQRTDKGREVRRYLISVEEAWNQPDIVMARALQMSAVRIEGLNEKVKTLEAKVEQDAPKVMFAEAVSVSDGSILIGELAKYLVQNGIKTGQNRLYDRLRTDGYLCSARGERWNLPTQRAMEMGLFAIKKNLIMTPDGPKEVKPTTMVTGRGQIFFLNKYRQQAG